MVGGSENKIPEIVTKEEAGELGSGPLTEVAK